MAQQIINMTRNELKQLWFSIPRDENKKDYKVIIVEVNKNPHWPGYGTIEITSDGPDGYSSFKTHQKNPLQYALDRIEESKGCEYKDLSEYKLVIK